RGGPQDIGVVHVDRYSTGSIHREPGDRGALEEAGLPFLPSRVVEAEFTEEGAYELTEGFISANPRLTAVFVASDLMAIGVMKRITELGLRVPEDISLMGFDDIVLSSYTTPKLSTIRQDFVGLGYAALEQVVKMLERNTPGYNKILPFSIVDRETIMIL
ncbi:LacI family transcriptional regulator, partial [Paenibacillus riograndensis]